MIYLVEDDENIRELVTYTLNSTGLEALGFADPHAFNKQMKKQLPELILLDIMLPMQDGLSLLNDLKANESTSNIPVIMLTAKGSEVDKVRGFELGADDYITKPFGMLELVARIKARLRHNKPHSERSKAYSVGSLVVFPDKHEVTVSGSPVQLTLKEFEMLCYLIENKGIVLTREKILDKIWNYSFDGESRTVDVHIRTLRQKLGDAANIIETVRGIGYKISGDK